jgi:serine/threonine protein kinase
MMIGKPISHYKIIEKLGEGGMGVVYRAEDTKLKRTVALKFLPPEMTRDPEAKARFIHEAQAASALQHHNICTIHDVDETEDGQIFIVMDYYQGETLKEKLTSQQLAVGNVVDISTQIAVGLQEAHGKGIVHRDIKPANIFITTEGIVKILDFGLAKLAGGQTTLTKTGSTLGTVAYMSPEQARGEEVDARTDIWSLGVVLYEMLAGELPFTAQYEQALVYSILNEQPKAIDLIQKDIPKQLLHIVHKSMEKNPALRYQSMKELVKDLAEVKTPSSQPKKEKAILVLPFADMSPGKDNEYFSDGLTEELITDLSGVHDLLVISRSSAMTFKGTKKTIREIASEVNVQYVLEGSVRKAGNNLRITAQLIDADNDFHMWAKKYDGNMDDVFDIQEKVSRSIVDALKLKLTSEEMEHLTERPIPNAIAYEFYLKARQEVLKYTEAGLGNALRYLQSGLEIVGENAVLYAGLAQVYFMYINLGLKEEKHCRKKAQEYIEKAMSSDPLSSQSQVVQGLFYTIDNPKKAIKHLKRVLATNPNDFDALFFLSCMLGSLGQKSAALPFEERTIKIDPFNPAAHIHSGFNRLWEGEYELARNVLGKLYQSFPEDMPTKFFYGLSLAYMKEKDKAGLIFDQITQEQPGGFFASFSLAFKNAIAGNKSDTLSALNSNPKLMKTRDFQYAFWITECLALIGEKEQALDWLERDVELGMVNYPLLNELDPFLAKIREEERFRKLMAKVKYQWEHFEV